MRASLRSSCVPASCVPASCVLASLLAALAGAGCGARPALSGRDAGHDLASDVTAPDSAGVDLPSDAPRPLDGAIFTSVVESFCAERARHQCPRLVRCHQAHEALDDCLVDDARTCAAALEGWGLGAVARGHLALDAEA